MSKDCDGLVQGVRNPSDAPRPMFDSNTQRLEASGGDAGNAAAGGGKRHEAVGRRGR